VSAPKQSSRREFLKLAAAGAASAAVLAAGAPAAPASPTTAPAAPKAAEPTKAPAAAEPTKAPAAAAKPTEAPKAAATGAVKTLKIGMSQEPDNLASWPGNMYVTAVAQNLFFESLVGVNDKMEPYAQLAEQIPTIENGGAKYVGEGENKQLVVTFKLKKGATWSNGDKLTSADVKFSSPGSTLFHRGLLSVPPLRGSGACRGGGIYDPSPVPTTRHRGRGMWRRSAHQAGGISVTGMLYFLLR
jgi:ABC-type transport system substrate-binding protein